VHTTGLLPVQTPAWHVSVCVHPLPSLHDTPFAFAGFEQLPVCVSQVPTPWHWSCAVHTTGLLPVHTPDRHVSVCVHPFPSLHPLPSGFAGLEQVPVCGSQVPAEWHES